MTELGPVVKQMLWGIPYALQSKSKLYAEVAVFGLLWASVAAAAPYLVRHRRTVFGQAPRMAMILAIWSVLPIVFGLTWLGSDTERWLSVSPVLWLAMLFVAVHAARRLRPAAGRLAKSALWFAVAAVFAHNLLFFAIPDHDPENNQYMRCAEFLNTKMSGNDLALVWGHDQVFTADHLAYFFGVKSLHLGQVGREQTREAFSVLDSNIRACWAQGGRVFVIGRVFLEEDLRESHRSDEHARIKRAEFARFFGTWRRSAAFTYKQDTYWELLEG
jgi:hypothetical protein